MVNNSAYYGNTGIRSSSSEANQKYDDFPEEGKHLGRKFVEFIFSKPVKTVAFVVATTVAVVAAAALAAFVTSLITPAIPIIAAVGGLIGLAVGVVAIALKCGTASKKVFEENKYAPDEQPTIYARGEGSTRSRPFRSFLAHKQVASQPQQEAEPFKKQASTDTGKGAPSNTKFNYRPVAPQRHDPQSPTR